jgi:hypothetical protein
MWDAGTPRAKRNALRSFVLSGIQHSLAKL